MAHFSSVPPLEIDMYQLHKIAALRSSSGRSAYAKRRSSEHHGPENLISPLRGTVQSSRHMMLGANGVHAPMRTPERRSARPVHSLQVTTRL